MMTTYLGQKGYTISKNALTAEQHAQIRKDLTIKPFVMGAPSHTDDTFFAFRESSNKFYLPHYYGVQHFGTPSQYRLSEGMDINLTFVGTPRDYQAPVIHKFLEHCKKSPCGGGLLELHTAWGKTSAALYISTQLRKKTLVIVHKEFLMNQWEERIHSFIPSARIGKIQGPVIDIENKDIVLCMLQSLIQKDYDPAIFAEFGFTIIDEVHHISSMSFSNSLFKVVTKYMLGISATMSRKDGTTSVFKLFLGDIVHKAERKTDMMVEVRAITYKSHDPEFNETILDYRGKPQISSMISKLCEYSRRTEFIIQTLCDVIRVDGVDQNLAYIHKRNMDSQIPECRLCNKNDAYLVKNTCCGCIQYCLRCMDNITLNCKEKSSRPKCPNCAKVLKFEQYYIDNPYVKPLHDIHIIVMSHNLNILHYMYNKIVCNNLASVGYYVGGMKEAELKKTETKQIVLSTYSMSSEGLDIPTLNVEFAITPKTDIVQSVGRILRAKHAHTHPIIYDFVDTHDIFQRQWAKRKAYYKKNNYMIIGTNNLDYNTNYATWKVMYSGTNTTAKTTHLTRVCDSDDDEEGTKPTLYSKCLLTIKDT